jgi:hypothetical protein
MLRLLLDEHLSPEIARQVRAKRSRLAIESVVTWENSLLAGAPDDLILRTACDRLWTLVTYDQATIVPLLKTWGEIGEPHGGVIFVDDRTIPSNDIGGLVRALVSVWDSEGDGDWRNAVLYLRRQG